jgi:hypothetical protein
MKTKLPKLITMLTTILFGVSCASTDNTPASKTAPDFLNQGLVAHYPFNGDAKDVSGNNNHGKITGATPTEDRLGKSKGALNFDDDLDYIEIPHSESLSFEKENFTISMWLRYPAQKGFVGGTSRSAKVAGLFNKSDPKSPDKGFPGVSIFANTFHDTVSLRLTGAKNAKGESETVIYDDKNLHDDTWRHFVFKKQGNTLVTYVNSLKVSHAQASILDTYKNKSMIVIGANHANRLVHSYLGRMDELRVYTRALSPREIKGLFDFESH